MTKEFAPPQAQNLCPQPTRALSLLLVCALGVVSFTCAGGFFVFLNTQHYDRSSAWLEHTHSVLDALHQQTTRLERIDYDMQLFAATGDEDHLRDAQSAVVSMDAGLLHTEDLVRDNQSQLRHAHELQAAVHQLSLPLEKPQEPRTVPGREIRECRSIINLMQNEERGLLDARTAESKKTLLSSYLWGAIYTLLSLGVMVSLFWVLVRDTLGRKVFEQRLSEANAALNTTVDALGQRVNESVLLKNARDELQLCVTPKQAYECASRHFEQLIPGSRGATIIVNNSRSMLVTASTWNDPPALLDSFDLSACCGLRAGRPRWRKNGESELHCGHFAGPPPTNYMCVPLAALGETLGFIFICLPDEESSDFAEARLGIIYELVELSAMATAGLNLRVKLENQSVRDGLTNLFNRHFMEIALERELQRSTRHGRPLALLMLDVDHFKTFNDTFGHEAGDLVLRELADCLQSSVRSEDIVCRYGGEEFVIILPEISEEMALVRAEAVRQKVSRVQVSFRGDHLRQISISVGLAMYPDPAKDAVELLRMADRALYAAKQSGRNQVKMLAA